MGGLTVWLARRVLEPAERLDRARVMLEDAYARARAESLRDALTGLGNHRAFQEELERQWVGVDPLQQPARPRDRRPRRFRQGQRVGGPCQRRPGARRAAATLTAGLRRTDRVFRIGGDEFAVLLPGVRCRGGVPVGPARPRRPRWKAGRSRARARTTGTSEAVVVHGRRLERVPGTAADRATLYREAEAALLTASATAGRASGLRRRAARLAGAWIARSPGSAAEVARVAAVGALRRGLPADLRPAATGSPRGYEGLVRPQPGLRLRRSPRAVRRRRGRRADRRAGPRLPDRLGHRVRRAGPARQPDPQHLAADPGVRPVQRPRPGQAAPAPRRRAGADRPGADRARGRRGHGPA